MNSTLLLAVCLLLAIAFGGLALLLGLALRGAAPELRPEILRALSSYVAESFSALAEVPTRLINSLDALVQRRK